MDITNPLSEREQRLLRWCRQMCTGLQDVLDLTYADELLTERGVDDLRAHVQGSLTDPVSVSQDRFIIPKMLTDEFGPFPDDED